VTTQRATKPPECVLAVAARWSATSCAQPFVAAAYALVKLALARRGLADWDLYLDVKDPVCDVIMVAAADWAGSVGWRTEPYS
jgi:hypothetical protein